MILSAPIEPVMGFVQKIFYFHVPCAIMLFLSTFVCAGGSIAFLFKGSERGDRLALASARAERPVRRLRAGVGAAVGAQGLGRLVAVGRAADQLAAAVPDDGRLPARAALRRAGAGASWRRRWRCSRPIDVPLVYKSVDIWRTVHPQTTVVPKLDPRMRPAFWSAFALITLVWALLLTLRVRLEARARPAGRRCGSTPRTSRRRGTPTNDARDDRIGSDPLR